MSLDTPDYTPWFRERPVDTKTYYWQGNLAVAVPHRMCDLPRQDVEIQRFVVGTNRIILAAHIIPYNDDGTLGDIIRLADDDGGSTLTPTLQHVEVVTSDIFDLLVYDTAEDRYKMSLARKLRFAFGVRVEIEILGGLAGRAACELQVLNRGVLP